jgi:hypothetical protein
VEKIEDLTTDYKTVIQALRYGLEVLDDQTLSSSDKISRAKHLIRDAMHILGYTDNLVETYKR